MFLFILFIDGLISYLKQHCVEEPLIGLIHCLLHADDTAILSTDRESFLKKCNLMLDYFNENSLSLNLSKSAYMIINGKATDVKTDLELSNELLVYKDEIVYLGVVYTDTGNVKHDIERYVYSKRSNITIKYNNFILRNYLAPLSVKLRVLDSCVSSTLVYGCEAWGLSNVSAIETAYRMGIKRALGVRECINNEIAYLETNRETLSIRIRKQQLKFWKMFKEQVEGDVTNPLNGLLKLGNDINLKFMKYYIDLETKFTTPGVCQRELKLEFHNNITRKINNAAEEDSESRLGVYRSVNPQLISPQYPPMLESERILISRYRCGSHSLRIETGRLCNPIIPREERLCKCNTAIQTLHHCLFDCPLLQHLYVLYDYATVEEAMNMDGIAILITKIEKILKISA